MYRIAGKRLLDLLVSVSALILLSPILAALALLVRWKMGTPILFRQARPGLNGESFTITKFRTMCDARDDEGNLLPDCERLTGLGRFLRATSLDELPELFNVVKGDMSLVGPRPLLIRYTPFFTDEERIRFAVRPGITGLAQISGRNELSWDSRLAADIEYVNTYSLLLDLRILWLTIWQVLARRGMDTDPSSVMLDLDEERRQVSGPTREIS